MTTSLLFKMIIEICSCRLAWEHAWACKPPWDRRDQAKLLLEPLRRRWPLSHHSWRLPRARRRALSGVVFNQNRRRVLVKIPPPSYNWMRRIRANTLLPLWWGEGAHEGLYKPGRLQGKRAWRSGEDHLQSHRTEPCEDLRGSGSASQRDPEQHRPSGGRRAPEDRGLRHGCILAPTLDNLGWRGWNRPCTCWWGREKGCMGARVDFPHSVCGTSWRGFSLPQGWDFPLLNPEWPFLCLAVCPPSLTLVDCFPAVFVCKG